MRGGGGGGCDERALSLFSSFQLFEASHQTGLNSRHDTISLSSTTTFLCLYLTHTSSPTSPPPIKALASIYLRPPASVHPFTGSQCRSVTSDRTLREETQPKRSRTSPRLPAYTHLPACIWLVSCCKYDLVSLLLLLGWNLKAFRVEGEG